MFKENKFATILFILLFGGLICVLAYTPFYLKEYKENLNREHQEEKLKEQQEKENNLKIEKDKDDTNAKTDKKEDKKEENDMEEPEKEPINLNLTIEVNGKKYIAKLEDNDTTRAFLKKLPLEVTMNELNGNEKYYRFDDKLPSNPTQVNKINKGDLMLYEDNTIVLFYDTFDTIYKYTKIGNIEENGMLMTNLGKKEIKVKFSQ